MRPRNVPEDSTVSLKVSPPNVGDTKFETPPIVRPAGSGKTGNEPSASIPSTKRFGSIQLQPACTPSSQLPPSVKALGDRYNPNEPPTGKPPSSGAKIQFGCPAASPIWPPT